MAAAEAKRGGSAADAAAAADAVASGDGAALAVLCVCVFGFYAGGCRVVGKGAAEQSPVMIRRFVASRLDRAFG